MPKTTKNATHKPLPPFLRYQGGKSKIAKKIVAIFPSHDKYVEPFVGGGSVFFAKNPAKKEVISDVDPSLMSFYHALKRGEVKRCDLTPNREKLRRIEVARKNGRTLKPCEYLYLNKLSYGGKGGSYDVAAFNDKCRGENARTCGVKSKDQEAYRQRLSKTSILSGDFRRVVKAQDSPKTLFYLDPPYHKLDTKGYVRADLTPQDLRKTVEDIRGKVVLSYNDHPAVRNEFCGAKKFKCRKVTTTYSLNNKNNSIIGKELIITNF